MVVRRPRGFFSNHLLCESSRSALGTTTIGTKASIGRTTVPCSRVTSFVRRFATTSTGNTDGSTVQGTNSKALSPQDLEYMQLAVDHAQRAKGWTFPNPAVGCVLVQETASESVILGQGFHPRAGYPHAEIFALLEAGGHVKDGVEAAQAVLESTNAKYNHKRKPSKEGGNDKATNTALTERVQDLLHQYSLDANQLFGNLFAKEEKEEEATSDSSVVTAYVTLEPCCHYGRTPPCATTFALAKVQRVVIGVRDPNPRVDGGGVQLLQEAGVDVTILSTTQYEDEESASSPEEEPPNETMVTTACRDLVQDFCQRIVPNPLFDYHKYMTGRHRMALRAAANQMTANGTLSVVEWTGPSLLQLLEKNKKDDKHSDSQDASNEEPSDVWSTLLPDDDDATMIQVVQQDCLSQMPEWMEFLDGQLWQNELVKVRLSKAAPKKRVVKQLGTALAHVLQAHVAQTQGHTLVLYRPANPPKLDLEHLLQTYK